MDASWTKTVYIHKSTEFFEMSLNEPRVKYPLYIVSFFFEHRLLVNSK